MKNIKLTKQVLLHNKFIRINDDGYLHLVITEELLNIAISTMDFSFVIYDKYIHFLRNGSSTGNPIEDINQFEALLYGLTGEKPKLKM